MNFLKPNLRRPSSCGRYREWKADMTLRHGWFRVLLHLEGMVRCPRNIRWHWRHITGQVCARRPGA
jgi:hypothetical protein